MKSLSAGNESKRATNDEMEILNYGCINKNLFLPLQLQNSTQLFMYKLKYKNYKIIQMPYKCIGYNEIK